MSEPRHVEVILEGVLQPKAHEPVARIPFHVPEGSTRVTLAYEHDAGHILDLGLQDPRGGPFPSIEGFRGWSGGARCEAFVALDDATPGYLAGDLPSGTWHALLGRAHVAAPGCQYRVDVRIDVEDASDSRHPEDSAGVTPVHPTVPVPTAPAATAPAPRSAPIDAPWFPGDLQSHTHHSDAKGSLDDLLGEAEDQGLAYLAVTDHNTVSHHAPLARHDGTRVLGIPGMEVTSYYGHANVWGASGWVDFRLVRDADVEWMVDRAHALGGVVSINHPKTQPGCIGCDWTFAIPAGVDAMEVWQGPWWLNNWESLARYDALLVEGRRISLVGGSDRHQQADFERDPAILKLGSPTTWLQVETLTLPHVLAALRTGRASVSESSAGPRLRVTAGATPTGGTVPAAQPCEVQARIVGAKGERLRWVAAEGVVRDVSIDTDDFQDVWMWPADGPFLRAEIIAEASLPTRLTEIEHAASQTPLPYGITPDDVRTHPWRLAISNPLYATEGGGNEARTG